MAERPSPYHGSWIELSGSALRSNLRFLRRLVGRRTEIASVVKGNAYGLGIEAFVPLAERCGVRRFAAFSASEALRVAACRQRGSEIMILVDVTDLGGVKRGSEVVIIGRQGHAEISIASFADMLNHLNYEVLVRLPNELPRVVVD